MIHVYFSGFFLELWFHNTFWVYDHGCSQYVYHDHGQGNNCRLNVLNEYFLYKLQKDLYPLFNIFANSFVHNQILDLSVNLGAASASEGWVATVF